MGVLTALGLAAGPAVGLGLARFGYALVLPAMRSSLGWSFAVAGGMNTANAAGYLIGAVGATWAGRVLGERRVFVGSIAVTVLALLASAATGNVVALMALRVVAGAAGAVTFVVGGGLTAHGTRGMDARRGSLMFGIYFGGGSLGMVASGAAVPLALAHGDWRPAWIVLGAIGVAGLVLGALAARSLPDPPPATEPAARDRPRGWPLPGLVPLTIAYVMFAGGYIAYMTFVIAYLEAGGAGGVEIGAFWIVLGAAAVVASFVWGPALAGLRGGRPTAVIMGLLFVGAALPLLGTSPPLAFASAVVFGGTFLAVPASVTSCTRRSLEPRRWTAAIGAATVAFALGQCVGPVLAGSLSDAAGGVRIGLAIGAATIAVGAVVAALQRARGPDETPV